MAQDFQTHNHTFTCEKKKKRISLQSTEGFGRNDGKIKGEKMNDIPNCRFNFPQFPLYRTSFILGMSKSLDSDEKKRRKSDLKKIRNFLIRASKSDEETDKYFKDFKSWSFIKFLHEVGMFEENKKTIAEYSPKEKMLALDRYLDALSASIRGSGHVFLKRSTGDLFVNNFNRRILQIHKANHDIQIVVDQVKQIY